MDRLLDRPVRLKPTTPTEFQRLLQRSHSPRSTDLERLLNRPVRSTVSRETKVPAVVKKAAVVAARKLGVKAARQLSATIGAYNASVTLDWEWTAQSGGGFSVVAPGADWQHDCQLAEQLTGWDDTVAVEDWHAQWASKFSPLYDSLHGSPCADGTSGNLLPSANRLGALPSPLTPPNTSFTRFRVWRKTLNQTSALPGYEWCATFMEAQVPFGETVTISQASSKAKAFPLMTVKGYRTHRERWKLGPPDYYGIGWNVGGRPRRPERKANIKGAWLVAWRILNNAFEFVEWVDMLATATGYDKKSRRPWAPKQRTMGYMGKFVRPNGPRSVFVDKMDWLFVEGHFFDLEVQEFVEAYSNNWTEDRQIGTASKGVKSLSQQSGRPIGFGYGPAL